MSNALLLAIAALGGYYVYKESQRKASRKSSSAPPAQPRIIIDSFCAWEIPDVWWSAVALPRLRAAIRDATEGTSTWEERKAAIAKLNSHAVAHALIFDQGTALCPIPPVDAKVYEVDPTASESEQRMLNLFASVIQNVEKALTDYVNSQGTKLTIGPEIFE